MAKKKVTLEQAEGLMALGTARQEKPEELPTKEENAERRHPRKQADEVQISAYVPRELHRKVKIALAEEGISFTALLTDFLKEWVKNR
jgi:hypothetical protein